MNFRFYTRLGILFCLLLITTTLKAQSLRLRNADDDYEHLAYTKALPLYEKESKTKDSSAYIFMRVGDCYRHLNQPKLAEPWYAKAVKYDDVDPEALFNYSTVLKENNRYAMADIWLQKFLKIKKDDPRAKRLIDNSSFVELLKSDTFIIKFKRLAINTPKTDFGSAFYQDGLVFSSAKREYVGLSDKYKWNGEPFLDLYISHRDKNGNYTECEPFSSELNSEYHEGPVSFTKNFDTIYFTRNTYIQKGRNNDRVNRLKLFRAILRNGKWTNVKELNFNNDSYSCGHATVTADGTKLYFVSDMPGGIGGTDIYVSNIIKGEPDKPVNLGPDINTEQDEMFPFIHPDGTLYFSSNGYKGLGGLDIYYAEPDKNGKFKTPRNMGFPINSSMDDFCFYFDKDKITGFLSSNRKDNNDDIYQFTVLPKPPVAVKDSIVCYKNDKDVIILPLANDKLGDGKVIWISGYSAVSAKGGTIILADDLKHVLYTPPKDFVGVDVGSYTICDSLPIKFRGCDDNVMIMNVLDKRPFTLEGLVVYRDNQQPIEGAKVSLYKADSTFVVSANTNNLGLMTSKLEEKTDYYAKFEYNDAFVSTVKFTTKGHEPGVIKIKAELERKIKGIRFRLDIYFDLDKYNIRADAKKLLDEKALTFLKDNPTVVIELSAHTDCRASVNYNNKLSQNRAESTVKYLIEHGIASSRMKAKGYGKSRLVNKCSDGVPCTEEEHQLNRRVEIEVLSW